MTRVAPALALLLLAACSKDENPSSKPAPAPPAPAPPAPALSPAPPAPVVSAPPTPFVVAADAKVISQDPLRWERAGHLWERSADPRTPRDLGERKALVSTVFDDDYWYESHCTAGCGSSHGQTHTLSRIGRRDGARKVIAVGNSNGDNFNHLRVVGDHLLWTTFSAYGEDGELSRVHRDGGAVEILWKDSAMWGYEVFPDGILAWSTTSVAWIPDGKPAQVLATGLKQVYDAARDASHVYIAEHGDAHEDDPINGRILRVAHGGGALEVMAGPVERPVGVAVDANHVYSMLEKLPEVVVSPKVMGPLRTIPLPRIGDPKCLFGFDQWSDPAGLYVQLGGFSRSCPDTLYFVPTR